MIKQVITKYKNEGLIPVVKAVYRRIWPSKARSFHLIKEIVSSGRGLEIGGISPVFQKKNILPIYPFIEYLDNCNFSGNTVWEGKISKGSTYYYDEIHEPGKQYVLEATDLNEIEDDAYDFLLSSHVIEHTANPIKALKEWMRVVKAGGYLILLLPHKDGTFDHSRPVTSLDHLIEDYQNDITEKDLTHLDEILTLHDLALDPEAGTHSQFVKRSEKNYENRCLHHHVFDSHLVVQLLDYLQLDIRMVEAIAPMHILIVARKPLYNSSPNNEKFYNYIRSNQFQSPFPSDQI